MLAVYYSSKYLIKIIKKNEDKFVLDFIWVLSLHQKITHNSKP